MIANPSRVLTTSGHFRSHNTGRLVLDALFPATSFMDTQVAMVNLLLRRTNAHNSICLVFAQPRFLGLPQNPFAHVVKEVP